MCKKWWVVDIQQNHKQRQRYIYPVMRFRWSDGDGYSAMISSQAELVAVLDTQGLIKHFENPATSHCWWQLLFLKEILLLLAMSPRTPSSQAN